MRSGRIQAMRAATAAIAAFFALVLLAVTPAFAGISGSVGLASPKILNLGQNFPGIITITNTSDGDNATETVRATDLFITPSCGSAVFNECTGFDPGVFLLGVLSAVPGTSCDGTDFEFGTPDPVTGEVPVNVVGGLPLLLGPANGLGALPPVCKIQISSKVLALPTKDSSPGGPPLTTLQTAHAALLGLVSQDNGDASGGSQTTVTGPNLGIVKTPDNGTVLAGQTATFSITVTNAASGPNPATGAATNVTINDPLPTGGGVVWTTPVTVPQLCAVNGPAGAQTLHCATQAVFPASDALSSIPVNGSFTVTVSAVTAVGQCTAMPNNNPPAQGTLSGATAHASNYVNAQGQSTTAFDVHDDGSITCQTPNVQIAKSDAVIAPTGSVNQYTATYTLTVSNPGDGTGTYTLFDTPAFPLAGITLDSMNVTTANTPTTGTVLPATYPLANPGNGTQQQISAAGLSLGAGATHTYTVVITFTTSAGVTNLTCDTTPNHGAFNTGTITGTSNLSDTGCGNIPGTPNVTIAKSNATIAATANPNQYTATYTLTVANPGTGTGTYTLFDTPAFPVAGITLNSMNATTANSPTTGTVLAGFPQANPVNGAQVQISAAGLSLASGATHTYTVVITFTTSAAATNLTCDTTPNHGAFNTGSITGTSNLSATGCGDIPGTPSMAITKSNATIVATANPSQYTATYTVTVANSGTAAGTYTLFDTPAFPLAGITLDSMNVTTANTPTTGTVLPGTYPLANPGNGTQQQISAASLSLAASTTHTYTVVITFTTSAQATNQACVGTTANNGAFNTASITGTASLSATGCGDIPVPCDITLEKTCTVAPLTTFPTNQTITALTMTWGGPGTIWVRATAGGVTTVKGDVAGIAPGTDVTVSGYNAADKTNGTAVWNLYGSKADADAGLTNATMIGQSKFSLNFTDPGMSSADDCFLPQGDNNGASCTVNAQTVACNNNWDLLKITGSSSTLDCNALADNTGQPESGCEVPALGGNVNYQYTVHNNTGAPVVVTVTDDKPSLHTVANAQTIPANNSQVFTAGPVNITEVTTNTAVATANTQGQNNQCTSTDTAIVVPQCFLGDPVRKVAYPYDLTNTNAKAPVVYCPTCQAGPYVATTFNESEVLKGTEPTVATVGGTVRMWYSDEHALSLGVSSVTASGTCNQANLDALHPGQGWVCPTNQSFGVTSFPTTAAAMTTLTGVAGTKALSAGFKKDGVTPAPAWFTSASSQIAFPFNPLAPAAGTLALAIGAPACPGGCDPSFRPVAPAMFCTDITDANTNLGDWQIVGGTGHGPDFVSGTWKSATSAVACTTSGSVTTCVPTTTVGADPQANVTHPANPVVWYAGPDADVPLGGKYDPLNNNPVKGLEAYGTDIRWNVDNQNLTCIDGVTGQPSVLGPGLHSGRVYRVQFLIHDGDQNKVGGDAGESCAVIALP